MTLTLSWPSSVSELSWKPLNVSSNSSNPDNDNTSASKVSWWWCAASFPSSSAKSSVTNNDLLEPWPCHFDVLKISFLGQTETSSQNKPPFWPGRKRGRLGYRGCFFSNFYKSDISLSAYCQIRKVGCLKYEIFKHPSCRYSPIVKYEKMDFKNQRFTNIHLFDIRL